MAEIKSSVDTNRKNIADIVPLDSPLAMYIEPTRLCNFRCFYCMHGTRGQEGGQLEKTRFELKHMEQKLFDKLVREIMEYPTMPKRICFSGLGEPLMNKSLPNMIKQLREAGFCERIDVITNGYLLTHEMADALIDAGISRLQISIQGLTNEKYKEISGVDIEMEKLIDNIKYYYEHKGNSAVYIKIIDCILENEDDKKLFFDMFSDICDTIYIEHLVVMQQQMGDHGGRTDMSKNLLGECVIPRKVCAVMFYYLQVNIDGETFPCPTPGLPNSLSMGSVYKKTLKEIWDGKRRNDLVRTNLIDGYVAIPECQNCSSCMVVGDKSEYLDDVWEQVLEKFPER